MRTSLTVLALTLAAASSHATAAPAPESPPAASADRTAEAAAQPAREALFIDGTIEAIDRERRILTLRDARGKGVRVHVADEVQAFERLAKGERIRARFGDALSLRLAEAGAWMQPQIGTRAPAQAAGDAEPAAGVAPRATLDAEVERIDADTRIVTLRGPRGDTTRVKLDAEAAELQPGAAVVLSLGDAGPLAAARRSAATSDLSGTVIRRESAGAGAQPGKASKPALATEPADAADGGMQRLLQASRELREAVEAMARMPAGPPREQAMDRAREALFDTQRAMMDLPRTGGAATGTTATLSGSDAGSAAGASTPTAGGVSLRLDSSTRSELPSGRSGPAVGTGR